MKKLGVFLQARIDSSRLPGKALFKIQGKTIVSHAMTALRQIDADVYALLTDENSFSSLFAEAKNNGFEIFKGSATDVLARFVSAGEFFKVKTIIRATGDNPLVDAETATLILDSHLLERADYSGFNGIPLGTGVEVLNFNSLLKAKNLSSKQYDHEHVSPFLYNNPNLFKINRIMAPPEYCFPKGLVTIDTKDDFDYVERLYSKLYKGIPLTTKKIIPWFKTKRTRIVQGNKKKILIIPSTLRGNGFGHLKRSIQLARDFREMGVYSAVLIDKSVFEDIKKIAKYESDTEQYFISSTNASEWNFCIFDYRKTPEPIFKKFYSKTITIGIDEGGAYRGNFDYLIDCLPNLEKSKPNISSTGFLKLPTKKKDKINSSFTKPLKILLTFGGEDAADLSNRLLKELKKSSLKISKIGLIMGPLFGNRSYPEDVEIINGSKDILNTFADWDLVFTSFGLSCFEALYSKTPVILFNPSTYHKKLSLKAGIPEVGVLKPNIKKIEMLLKNPEILMESVQQYSIMKKHNLANFINSLSNIDKGCRGCGKTHSEMLYRTKEFSFYRCTNCGLINQINFYYKEILYNKDYFFDDYKKQYGSTYLEDFNNIKKAGLKRCKIIKRHKQKGNLLDVGCGYGAFLSAATETDFTSYGIDLSDEAINWVSTNLGFSVSTVSAEGFDPEIFNLNKFDVITMWFVIEHIQNLPIVLTKINKMLKTGGVLAVATPNYSGISFKKNMPSFLQTNPIDHYTIWNPVSAGKILKKYGFTLKQTKCPTIHPDRFFKKGTYKKLPPLLRKICAFALIIIGKLFKLGDTFEVYAIKN